MTGWAKVAAATGVAVAGLAGLNLSLWRRLKLARERASSQPVESDDRH